MTEELDKQFPGWSTHFPTLYEFVRSQKAQAAENAARTVMEAVEGTECVIVTKNKANGWLEQCDDCDQRVTAARSAAAPFLKNKGE